LRHWGLGGTPGNSISVEVAFAAAFAPFASVASPGARLV
jgi:hypothetical protein